MSGRRLRVLVVGDPYFDCDAFRHGFGSLPDIVDLSYLQVESTASPVPRTESEAGLRESVGDPRAIAAALAGHDVLVVHGAGVSAEVLATPGLQLVCCARGGPVNVDVAAASALGVRVCSSPGKNAEAVAELTIGFALMLIRGVFTAQRDLATGHGPLASVFDGARYFGFEGAGSTLGLVGYGFVGRQVAWRARALGFTVIAHDPNMVADPDDRTELLPLDEVLARSRVVSLHARFTEQTRHLMDAAHFAQMQPGAFFINTAREQLVDEAALLTALRSGALAGAALDVIEYGDGRNPLLDLPQVLVTPHIGGATFETLRRGAGMAAESVEALVSGGPLPYLVNAEAARVGAAPEGREGLA